MDNNSSNIKLIVLNLEIVENKAYLVEVVLEGDFPNSKLVSYKLILDKGLGQEERDYIISVLSQRFVRAWVDLYNINLVPKIKENFEVVEVSTIVEYE